MKKPIVMIGVCVVLCLRADGMLKLAAQLRTSVDPSFNPETIPKLAVIVLSAHPTSGTRGAARGERAQGAPERFVEDAFVGVLMRKGYSVVSRSDLESVLKEQKFQKSGLTESDAAAIGKILNVPAVMLVGVTEMSTQSKRLSANRSVTEATAGMGVRVIGVENANVLWISTFRMSRNLSSKSDASEVLGDVARKIATAFPPRKSAKKSTERKTGSGKNDNDAPKDGTED